MMKALSIKQPWAWLILNYGKNIENRTWNSNYRGKFYVHAGKSVDKDVLKAFREHCKANNIDCPEIFPTGGIVGEVEMFNCVPIASNLASPWAEGPYCFLLKDPVAYETLIPCKGQLGFFDVSEIMKENQNESI